MSGLTAVRPKFCLRIGAQVMAWGESTRTWRGRGRYRCAVSPTPPGSVKLSPIEPNLSNPTLLEERLRSLAGPNPRIRFAGHTLLQDMPRLITLLLPDLAVRTIVMSLDELPPRPDEQEALIRWRLGQDQRVSVAGSKLFWQVFPSLSSENRGYGLFVVAVMDNVLTQYERLCESAGLLPQRVGVTSLYLFNLWMHAVGGEGRLPRGLASFALSDGGLSCAILHDGRPVFARTKLLAMEGAGDKPMAVDMRERIVRECAVSLVACREHHPHVQVRHAVFMTEEDIPGLDEALGNELGIAVSRLEWDHLASLGWSHQGGSLSAAALPAVAGLV